MPDRHVRLYGDHTVQFYEDDASVASAAANFLVRALGDGHRAVAITTPEHARLIVAELAAQGVKIDAAQSEGRLALLDVPATLQLFLRDGMPDADVFHATMDRVIDARPAGDRWRAARVYDEMVDVLWRKGGTAAAIRMEDLWNDVLTRHNASLFCAYSLASFYRESDADRVRDICDRHTRIIPVGAQGSTATSTWQTELADLRARNRSYEAEVKQREQLEQRLRDTVIRLQEREEDLSDVLENAAEGIHLVGADGIIQWANRAELEMLGYARDEYVGHNVVEFHDDDVLCRELLSRLKRGETLQRHETRLRCKDGSVRHVVINSSVRRREGAFVHARCFTTDVTEARQAAAERERALARERAARTDAERARTEAMRALAAAEQASRAKSEFLAVMSHELRTPLNAIGGYAELMELGVYGAVAPQQREALDRIQRSQRMLMGLINGVLNYTRIETGNVQYHIAKVRVMEMLRVTEALIAPQMGAKGLKYEYGSCSATASCRADAEKVQQILLNLLSNAAKFTQRGGTVRVEPKVTGANVTIKVRDNGIGIAPEKLEQIFEPFVQIDANYTRTRDGVGLGLAISRDLARGMGGELTVESALSVGSTFTLKLARG